MDIFNLRKEYDKACFNGDFDSLKKIINSYDGNDLDPDPKYSEALTWAMRRGHFEIAEYLLSNEEVKQNYLIPPSLITHLNRYNKEVTRFILNNNAVKAKFNVFGHKDDYVSVLKTACGYDFKEEVNYLISAPESEKFLEEKMRALSIISAMPKPDLKIFDKILSQLSEYFENDKKLMQKKLTEWLFSSLAHPININQLPHYLIFDKDIQIEHADRLFIKENFLECEKLFTTRDLKKDLSSELNIENTINKKSNKL